MAFYMTSLGLLLLIVAFFSSPRSVAFATSSSGFR